MTPLLGPSKILPQPLLHLPPRQGIYFIRPRCRLYVHNTPLLLIVLHDRHTRLHKRLKALLNTLLIIIRPTARLSPLQQPLLHHIFRNIKKQHKPRRTHRFLKLERLVHLPRKAIDEELPLYRTGFLEGLGHGVLEQLHGHFHGHYAAVPDAVLDERAELAAGPVLLGAEEVAGAEVREVVVAHEIGALGAFAGAGAAEDEEDGYVRGVEGGCLLFRGGQLPAVFRGVDCGGHVCS